MDVFDPLRISKIAVFEKTTNGETWIIYIYIYINSTILYDFMVICAKMSGYIANNLR